MTQTARRRSASEWAVLVRQWQSSGEQVQAFASQHGVRAGTLSWWSSELRRRSAQREDRAKSKAPASRSPAFAEVRVVSSSASTAGGSVEVHAQSGWVVRVQGAVDPALLVSVLRAVSQC